MGTALLVLAAAVSRAAALAATSAADGDRDPACKLGAATYLTAADFFLE
jgi:hypothetical protein